MEILHLLGLCPDTFAHIDLMDIVIANYNQIVQSVLIYLNK
jgi:hypothetical protein